MDGFDFAFTLFGLVLGLAMAEVLGGFVRVLKVRTPRPASATGEEPAPASSSAAVGQEESIPASSSAAVGRHIHIGWLTPVGALLVVLDLLTSWLLAWSLRAQLPVTFPTLVGGTAVCALYYVMASLVWPDDPRDWPDLDDWFDRHKAQIAGAIALANTGYLAISFLGWDWQGLVLQFAYIALAALLMLTRRRWQSGAVMAAMLGLIVWGWL